MIALFLFGRRNPILTIALFSVMVGALIFSIHTATLHHSLVNTFAGKTSEVVIRAVVTSEPKQKPDRVRGSHLQQGKISFLARTTTLHSGDEHYRVRVPIRILSPGISSIVVLDKIRIGTGFLIKTAEKRVAATLIDSDKISKNADAYPALKLLAEVRADYRNRLSRFGDNAGALIPGMIIGDTSLQSSEFSDQMRKAGLSHLTAVSGANFAIVSSLVFILCRRIIPTILPRLIVTSGFLILFLLLVRPSP